MNVIPVGLLLLLYATRSKLTKAETTLGKNDCVDYREYHLIAYDCSLMMLRDVPQNTRSSVEIFNLSMNRIHVIRTNSFKRYPNVKFLYLFDNVIQMIEEGAFIHLSDLEVVDLSVNYLSTISLELFQMPLLRNLYYSNNTLSDMDHDLKRLEKPVIAPLQKLYFTNCRLSSVPDFGILPYLSELNISHNPMDQITAQQFSPFCSLERVALGHTNGMSPCMCKQLRAYFDRRHIQLTEWFDCPTIHEESAHCTGSMNATETPKFDECKALLAEKQRHEKSKKIWYWILCCLGAILVTIIYISFLCFHRRNDNKAEKIDEFSENSSNVHCENDMTP